MTVYELIQELANYNSDTEVQVSFELDDDREFITKDFNITRIGHRIYIEARE